MSFHLAPTYYDNFFPFTGSNDDRRLMRRMMDITNPSAGSTTTIEPSYRYEADKESARFEIELPGVAKENISIDVVDNKLIVKAERFRRHLPEAAEKAPNEDGVKDNEKTGDEAKEAKPVPSVIYLLEARLPPNVDLDAVKAGNYADGILALTIPMNADAGNRRIQIGL